MRRQQSQGTYTRASARMQHQGSRLTAPRASNKRGAIGLRTRVARYLGALGAAAVVGASACDGASGPTPSAGSHGNPPPMREDAGMPDVNSQQPSDAGGTSEGGKGVSTVPIRAMGADHLGELQTYCEESGGVFVDASCVCPRDPSSGVSAVFTSQSEPHCRPLALGSSSCGTKGYAATLTSGGFSALQACLDGSLLRVGRSSVSIAKPVPEAMATELAGWLDSEVVTLKLAAKLPGDAGAAQSVGISLGKPDLALLPVLLDNLPYPMPGTRQITTQYTRTLFARSVQDIANVVGAKRSTWQPNRADAAPALQALLGAADEASFADAEHYEQTPILNGCIGACDVTRKWERSQSGQDYLVARTRRYHGGTVLEDRLVLSSRDGKQVFGVLVYDLGGNPNYLVTFEYPDSPFQVVLHAYDGVLSSWGEMRFDALADAQLQDLTGTPVLGADEAAVVVCEGDFGGPLDAEIARTLVLGPHAAPAGTDDASFYGWRRARANDTRGYLEGLISMTYTLPASNEHYALHTRTSARLALGIDGGAQAVPGLRVLPLSERTCILDPDMLSEIAAHPDANRIRILSLSATLPVDQAACMERFPSGVPEHFLWVTAAGNFGRRVEDLRSAQNCPQNLPRRSNLLVVDGVIGTDYWELNDFGEQYTDIAADCRLEDGACNGTSNAAPRVARVAARIVQAYGGRISVPMVRAAILLSAQIPDMPLPNRTGGMLAPEQALQAAQEIVDRGFGTKDRLSKEEAQAVLEKLYGNVVHQDMKLPRFKLDRLEQNAFFAE